MISVFTRKSLTRGSPGMGDTGPFTDLVETLCYKSLFVISVSATFWGKLRPSIFSEKNEKLVGR